MTDRITALAGRALVGTHEHVALPDWGIAKLRAKVDTGAKNSALHVEDIELLDAGDVRFAVRLDRKDRTQRVFCTATVARRGRVRSSTGVLESRIFVRTTVRIGVFEEEVEVSLVDRGKMLYRMLIGRETLRAGDFLVDVHRRYVQKVRRSKATKKTKKTGKKPRNPGSSPKTRRPRTAESDPTT